MDWGHLAAGDAALNAAFTRDGHQYDMLGDEADHMVPSGQQDSANGGTAPMGRGRDMVQPAWMTNPGAAIAPGSEGMPAVMPALQTCLTHPSYCARVMFLLI